MKNTSLKKGVITVSLLLSVVYIGIASAHDYHGSLGTSAAATDMFQISCFDDQDGSGESEHLYLEISDTSRVPGLKVSAQLFLNGKAFNTTDAGTGSPAIKFNGGNNVTYILTVDKSAAGAAGYDIVYHCENKTGGHTGTTSPPFTLQDQ